MQTTPARIEAWLAPLADLIGPAYPWLNGLHVLSIGLLVGAITVLDLRLLGGFRTVAVSQLAGPTVRVAASGLAAAVLTGSLLFSVQPVHYLANTAFLAKLAIITIGLMNLALLRLLPGWQQALRDESVPGGIRIMAGVSLLTWFTAVFAGRWIAFL